MGVVTQIEGIALRGDQDKPWAHAPGCGCRCDQTFTCNRCGRRVGHCLGGYDNMPEACNFCWRPPIGEPS